MRIQSYIDVGCKIVEIHNVFLTERLPIITSFTTIITMGKRLGVCRVGVDAV